MAHEMQMRDGGILWVKFSGDFDTEDVDVYLEDFAAILESATGTIHFLIDVSEVGKASAGARKAFGEMFRDPHPRTGKSAMFGASRYIRVVTGFVVKVTAQKNLRIFDTEEEALAWLKE